MDSGENDLITWSDETLIEMFQNDVSFYRSIVLLIHCSWGFTSTNSRYLCSSHRDATCVERVKKTRMKSLCSIDMQPLTDTSQIIIYIHSSDPTPLFQLFIKFSLLSLSSHKIAPQIKNCQFENYRCETQNPVRRWYQTNLKCVNTDRPRRCTHPAIADSMGIEKDLLGVDKYNCA